MKRAAIAAILAIVLCFGSVFAESINDVIKFLNSHRDVSQEARAAAQNYMESDSLPVMSADEQKFFALGFCYGFDESRASSGTTRTSAVSTTYVVNTNTDKFHEPSCRSVKDIKPGNQYTYTGSRDLLVNLGFSPCGNCKP